MATVGKLAFSVILVIGAITGILSFFIFNAAVPEAGITGSIYRKDLPIITPAEPAPEGDTETQSASSEQSPPASAATLIALAGSATQGNPDYDPDPLTIKVGESVTVQNEDTVPHTVTSGEAPGGEAGQLFDTSIIDPAGSATLDTSSLEVGEYPYHCMVHPYMKGVLTVS